VFIHAFAGSKTPKECIAGTFTNATHQPSCQPCPEGFYCLPVNLTANPYSGYTKCPAGYYCPTGTGRDWKPCVPGTFSNQTGLSRLDQCKDCPAQKYCSEYHALTYTGECEGGHYCVRGVDRPHPVENVTVSEANCTRMGLHTGMFHISFNFQFHFYSNILHNILYITYNM